MSHKFFKENGVMSMLTPERTRENFTAETTLNEGCWAWRYRKDDKELTLFDPFNDKEFFMRGMKYFGRYDEGFIDDVELKDLFDWLFNHKTTFKDINHDEYPKKVRRWVKRNQKVYKLCVLESEK